MNTPFDFTIGTISVDREESLELFRDSFVKNTSNSYNIETVLVSNTEPHMKRREWLGSFSNGSRTHLMNAIPESCSANWHKIMQAASNEWVIILNDDIEFVKDWDLQFMQLVYEKDFGCFGLCSPNSFSGFAISKTFYAEHGPFRKDYVTGGHEDEDFTLCVAKNKGLHTFAEVREKAIYFLWTEEERRLFIHRPVMSYRSKSWVRQNRNKPIFDRFWKTVPGPTPETYQGKCGKHYLYVGLE